MSSTTPPPSLFKYNGGHLRLTHRGQVTSGIAGNGAYALGPSYMAGPSSDRPNLFGSPSFPTPLDRVRSAKRERAAQVGLGACCASPPTPQVWLRRTLSSDSEPPTPSGACGGQRRSHAGLIGSPLRNVATALASRVERALPGSPTRTKRGNRSYEGEKLSADSNERPTDQKERLSGVHCALEDFTGKRRGADLGRGELGAHYC